MSATRAPLIQTLDRGLRVLECLAGSEEGLTVAEIAERIGIHRAAAYRVANTLEAHSLIARTQNGRYRLWTGLLELSRGVLPTLRAASTPVLSRLSEELRATADITVLDGDDAVVLAVVEPQAAPFHLAYRPGVRLPIGLGASGKAILSGRPPREGEPPEIAAARSRGYAVSDSELQVGVFGIAVPVIVGDRPAEASVGAFALGELPPGATERLQAAAGEIAALLR